MSQLQQRSDEDVKWTRILSQAEDPIHYFLSLFCIMSNWQYEGDRTAQKGVGQTHRRVSTEGGRVRGEEEEIVISLL